MVDDDSSDYTDCRVMVDGNGEVFRNGDGGYCMLNVKDKSVIVLPPSEESEALINKLLLQSEEESNEPVMEVELKIKPEEVLTSISRDSNETTSSYWFTPISDVEGCKNCTELLIYIVGTESVQKMLHDKNTSKKKVWQVIAKKMSAYGFKVPGMTLADQGEKAHQKWRNIEKIYVKFKNHLKQTCNDPVRLPPPYYEAMDKVLAKKYDSHPKFVFDSLPPNSTNGRTSVTDDDTDDSITVSSEEQYSELEYNGGMEEEEEGEDNQSSRTKYKSREELFLGEIKNTIIEQCKIDREAQKRRHEEIKDILERQIEQRDDMLFILRELVEQSEVKNRKRSYSG